MAVQRPNVIVYQEYRNITVAPDVPDLNCLIVGPCYQLMDYVDDKADLYSTLYGTVDTANPLTTIAAVSISTPPGMAAGALLVDESVRVFFDTVQAVLYADAVGTGANAATFYTGDNLFWTTRTTGANFNAIGMQAGDKLVTQYNATPTDYVKTVKEMAFILFDSGAGTPLSFTTAGVEAGDIITVSADAASPARNGTYIVKNKFVASGSVVADSIEIQDATNLVGAVGVATVLITSAAGTEKYNQAGVSLGDWCHARMTSDFASTNVSNPNRKWRVERTLSDVELESTQFSVDPTSKVTTVNSAITVDVSSTLTNKTVSYAKIYVEYKALRQDLQNVTEFSSFALMGDELGKLDARNPLFVGAYVAQANTTTPIKVYGLASDDLAGYLDFIDRTSSERNIYAIVPLTYDTAILGALKSMAENYSDPTYVLSHGIKQKFRVILGAVDLATQKYVVAATGGASTAAVAGTVPGTTRHTFTIATQTNQVATADFAAVGVIPGDVLAFGYGGVSYGPFTVAHVCSPVTAAQVLEVSSEVGATELPNITGASVPNDLDFVHITPAAGGTKRVDLDSNIVGSRAFTLTTTALDTLFLRLSCPTADFISSGVVPGDYIQVPTDPEVNSFTTYSTFTVAETESSTRLRIVNNGTNQAELENELPHGVKRTAATDRMVSAGTVYFRVMRDMTRDQQVTYMSEVATSFSSKRTLLCYPDEVDVTDLVDGSLPRGTSTEAIAADAQPGYYLACCVGGQTAGQPPQQGFTNMGVNAIARIYNSSEYFTETQLTTLSNSGVYVFVQDNPTALPYSIHEVTTDVLSLETGEYMVVKDFDYIAWTFLDTLFPFLGKWNITPDAIRFVKQSLYSTVANLKSQYRAKIGAPLIDATIDSVFQNTDVSSDRIEAYVSVNLPMTLNVIGLHLVA